MSKPSDYPPGWREFARSLKDEMEWKCERCGQKHNPPAGYCLTVHHLTGFKMLPFSERWGFACLCQRCHLKIQGRVKMDQLFFSEILAVSPWFKPHLEGYLRSKEARE